MQNPRLIPLAARAAGEPVDPGAFHVWDKSRLASLPGYDAYTDREKWELPKDDFLAALLAPVADRLRGFVLFEEQGPDTAIYALLDDQQLYPVLIPTLPSIHCYWEVFGRIARAAEPDWPLAAAQLARGVISADFAQFVWPEFSKAYRDHQRVLETEAKLSEIGPTLVESPWEHQKQEFSDDLHHRYTAHYASDGKRVYLAENGRIQKLYRNSDPKTFRILSEVFALDRNNVYVLGEIVPKVDPATFRVIHEDLRSYLYIFADRSHAWGRKSLMKGVDPNGLTVLNRFYARNATQVIDLYSLKPITGADATTFEVTDDAGNARDSQRDYFLALKPRWSPELFAEELRRDPYGCVRAGQAGIKSRRRKPNKP